MTTAINVDLDYYLIVIHGLSVERGETYFNMRINSNRINFFASHGSTIHFNKFPVLNNISPFIINTNNTYSRNDEYFNNLYNIIKYFSGISHQVGTEQNIDTITIFPDEELNVFKMPPMVFRVNEDDATNEKSVLIGIYKYSITNPNTYVQVFSIQQLYNYSRRINQYGLLTYRDIIDIIFDLNGRNKDYRYNLGFFCCRDLTSDLNNFYNTPIFINTYRSLFNPIEKIYPKLRKGGNILDSETDGLTGYFLPLYICTPFHNTNLKRWERILGQRQQGCALNVLTYYNFMIEPFARQGVSCLNREGTSIFRIIDYLHVYLTNRNPLSPRPIYADKITNDSIDEIGLINTWLGMTINHTTYPNGFLPQSLPIDTKYTVLRLPIVQFTEKIDEILKCIYLLRKPCNFVTIIKFYNDRLKNGKIIMAGHTVSFLFQLDERTGTGYVFLVDPQNFDEFPVISPVFIKRGFNSPIEYQKDQLSLKFYEHYNKTYKFFDIIYIKNEYITGMVNEGIQQGINIDSFMVNMDNARDYVLPYIDHLINGGKVSIPFKKIFKLENVDRLENIDKVNNKTLKSKSRRRSSNKSLSRRRSSNKSLSRRRTSKKRSSRSVKSSSASLVKKSIKLPSEHLQISKKKGETGSSEKDIKNFVDGLRIDDKDTDISQDYMNAVKTALSEKPIFKPTNESKEFNTYIDNVTKGIKENTIPSEYEFRNFAEFAPK